MLTRERNPLGDILTDIITFGKIPPRFPTYEINREIEKQMKGKSNGR